MDWEEAGRAWGDRALDWAYLVEPYARRANETLFDQLGVGQGTRLLDIACGSGYAAALAAGRGAEVSGLDASQALITIARARTPGADLRVGDMFALPFGDSVFDVATSFNGIWKGCEDALAEARRVVRPGGMVGLTFWGAPKRMGLLPYFMTVAALSPSDHAEATINQGDTGRPGWPSRCSPTRAWSPWHAGPPRCSTNSRTPTWRCARWPPPGRPGPPSIRPAVTVSPPP